MDSTFDFHMFLIQVAQNIHYDSRSVIPFIYSGSTKDVTNDTTIDILAQLTNKCDSNGNAMLNQDNIDRLTWILLEFNCVRAVEQIRQAGKYNIDYKNTTSNVVRGLFQNIPGAYDRLVMAKFFYEVNKTDPHFDSIIYLMYNGSKNFYKPAVWTDALFFWYTKEGVNTSTIITFIKKLMRTQRTNSIDILMKYFPEEYQQAQRIYAEEQNKMTSGSVQK